MLIKLLTTILLLSSSLTTAQDIFQSPTPSSSHSVRVQRRQLKKDPVAVVGQGLSSPPQQQQQTEEKKSPVIVKGSDSVVPKESVVDKMPVVKPTGNINVDKNDEPSPVDEENTSVVYVEKEDVPLTAIVTEKKDTVEKIEPEQTEGRRERPQRPTNMAAFDYDNIQSIIGGEEIVPGSRPYLLSIGADYFGHWW
jgi:hypothetical protein